MYLRIMALVGLPVAVLWTISFLFAPEIEQCEQNLTLFSNLKGPEAFLVNDSGKVVLEWATPKSSSGWQVVHMYPDGQLLVLARGAGVRALRSNSEIIWELNGRYHHELGVLPGSDIFTISSKQEFRDFQKRPTPFLVNYLTIITGEGKVKKEFDLLTPVQALIQDRTTPTLKAFTKTRLNEFWVDGTTADVLHVNSVQPIFDGAEVDGVPRRWVVSYRNLSTVIVFDSVAGRAEWISKKGLLDLQHSAVLTAEQKSILIFDNGVDEKFSRIREIDLQTGHPVRILPKNGRLPFTYTRGNVQELCDGSIFVGAVQHRFGYQLSKEGFILGRVNWHKWYAALRKERGLPPVEFTLYRIYRVATPRIPSKAETLSPMGSPE